MTLALQPCFLSLLLVAASQPVTPSPPRLLFVQAIDADGTAAPLWLAIVAKRHPENANAASAPKPMTPGERRWAELIEARADAWKIDIPSLAANFAPVAAPDVVTVVTGNRGGEDAFTHDAVTIAFDVSRLDSQYGDARLAKNTDLIDRLFRHEYTHVLQKAWLAQHPYEPHDPLGRAILELWTEGLGNYYSLSGQWRARDGAVSPLAASTLAELQPRFLARMAMLSCACDTRVDSIMSTISSGPFAKKWGALPVALWLDREQSRAGDAIRKFVANGPEGVWQFLEQQLPEERLMLEEIRAGSAACDAVQDIRNGDTDVHRELASCSGVPLTRLTVDDVRIRTPHERASVLSETVCLAAFREIKPHHLVEDVCDLTHSATGPETSRDRRLATCRAARLSRRRRQSCR